MLKTLPDIEQYNKEFPKVEEEIRILLRPEQYMGIIAEHFKSSIEEGYAINYLQLTCNKDIEIVIRNNAAALNSKG
jgi:hypothetical protein